MFPSLLLHGRIHAGRDEIWVASNVFIKSLGVRCGTAFDLSGVRRGTAFDMAVVPP